MGRLLRKKASQKVKTRKDSVQTEAAESETGVSTGPKAVAAADVRKEARRMPAPAGKKAAGPGRLAEISYIQKSLQFLREVKVELKKVTWPSRKQTLGSTVVVIVLVIIVAIFLGTVDAGLSTLIRRLL
jgi:preprotein translocase subunit SecE